MLKIAVFGGTGYLASLIKNQNKENKNKYIFFSRKKNQQNYIDYKLLKKNFNKFKNFDYVIHLVGSNQNKLIKNKNLIKKKNKITSDICDLCLTNNIKLIYISSLQIYKNYGKNNLTIESKINYKNSYSQSHFKSEEIIKKKFFSYKNTFMILRVGNIFGFKKYEKLPEIHNNIIHKLCISALKKKKIVIEKGFLQRTFIPSQIFVDTINTLIKKNLFNNSIVNISYKIFSLKEVAYLIKKRLELILNYKVDIKIKKSFNLKKFTVSCSKKFRYKFNKHQINHEVDRILKNLNK